MNWTIIVIVDIAVVALVVFLVLRNIKDKKELEEKIKQDYKKPRDDEGDIEVEDAHRP